MKRLISIALLIAISLSGCNTPNPTPPKLIRYTKCDGMEVKPRRDGSLSPKDSTVIVKCYKGMKRYYVKRDAYYNRIMNGK